jgi:hypothetical protein
MERGGLPRADATAVEATAGIGACLGFYNKESQHLSLGYRTPSWIYQECPWLWMIGFGETPPLPPLSRASSTSGKMLAFASVPAGTTANKMN